MGCGASKGRSSSENESITFKHLGVHSMDEFFNKCKEIVDQFKELTSPLDEAKD